MKQIFSSDFEEAMRLIACQDSFALSRFADGEACVLQNKTVGNSDGWLFKQNKNLIFRRDLRHSLLCNDPHYYYGLSCSCCDRPNHEYLTNLVRAPLTNLTFSNIWVNANYSKFNDTFFETLNKTGKEIIFCSGSKARLGELQQRIPICDFISIPGNCVQWWEKNRDFARGIFDLKASQYSNAIFLFSLGPLSEILIYLMWQANPNNIYLDIGSTLDPYVFKRSSRSYHKPGDEFLSRICVWDSIA